MSKTDSIELLVCTSCRAGRAEPDNEKRQGTVLFEAIKQEALEPLSQPDLSGGFEGLLATFEPGSELTITLEADVAPTPKLKTTRGLTAEFEPVERALAP